jgi:hypothetical protein
MFVKIGNLTFAPRGTITIHNDTGRAMKVRIPASGFYQSEAWFEIPCGLTG